MNLHKRLSNELLYEEFHKTAQIQKKIISRNNFTYRHIINLAQKYLRQRERVLDIGCGVGTVSLYFGSKGYMVKGIDISEKAISTAMLSAKYLGFKNVTFDAINFPKSIPKGKFDFILCCEVIEHLEDDVLAIKKIYQLLKKNGIAIFTTPSKNAPLYRLGLANKFDRKVGHLRRYTIASLSKKIRESKFIILETRKSEGILRNFLFLNPIAGKIIRFLKFFLSDIFTYLDLVTLKVFGESNILIVAKKS